MSGPRTGAHISLHFQMLFWLIEGPPRTKTQFATEFQCEPDKCKLYFDTALRLGMIKLSHKEGHRYVYIPVRPLVPKISLLPPGMQSTLARANELLAKAGGCPGCGSPIVGVHKSPCPEADKHLD